MKKIPTLFDRLYYGHKIVGITDSVHEGMDWVLNGEGVATVKIDGSCCAIINGVLYKRYDAKKGKTPPIGAIPCQPEPDPITGHWPHWIKVDYNNPSDKGFRLAFIYTLDDCYKAGRHEGLIDGTYEAIGPHFQGNPYNLPEDRLVKHGTEIVYVERSFSGIKQYLQNHEIEGIVFWKDGKPQCKIKRSDFGFEWPVKKGSENEQQ